METQKDMKTPSVSFLESQAKLVNFLFNYEGLLTSKLPLWQTIYIQSGKQPSSCLVLDNHVICIKAPALSFLSLNVKKKIEVINSHANHHCLVKSFYMFFFECLILFFLRCKNVSCHTKCLIQTHCILIV